MKVINVDDLIIILSRLDNRVTDLDMSDFEEILDIYGDDYFACGNHFEKTETSSAMDKIRPFGVKPDIRAMNNRALYAPQSVYDRIVNNPNGVPVCTVDRDLIYIKAIEEEE